MRMTTGAFDWGGLPSGSEMPIATGVVTDFGTRIAALAIPDFANHLKNNRILILNLRFQAINIVPMWDFF